MKVTVPLMLTSWALLAWNSASQTQTRRWPEWFGDSLQYKCRCKNNMCDTNGTCRDGGDCEPGWFGPACQYADLAYRSNSSSWQATDGSDRTCLTPSSNMDNVTVKLNISYLVNWLRVRLNNSDPMDRLEVGFRQDGSLRCGNKRTARVDDTTLDIHCDVDQKVQHVILSGQAIEHLCSVQISGGRNVALNQNAEQSTTITYKKREYPATLAVDGNRNADFSVGTCSHTDPKKSDASLNVTFSRLQHVTRYVLYNRNNLMNRLKGFELRSFTSKSGQVFPYKDQTDTSQLVYTVVPDSVHSSIHLVNVAVNNTEQILTLCELEIYGDSVCQPNLYGRECNQSCNCAGGRACFVSTGGCPSGCADGFQGEDCWTSCGPGRYGAGCLSSCSQNCMRSNLTGAGICASTDGTCLHGCRSGYQGPTCAQQTPNIDDEFITVVVVAVLFCMIAVVILVVVIVLFWRRHTSSPPAEALVVEDHISKVHPSTSPMVPKIKDAFRAKRTKRRNEDSNACSNGIYSNICCESSSTVISLHQLSSFMASKDRPFFENQFMTIPNNQAASMIVGLSPDNRHKNRYKNICAYDHSRVHLSENVDKQHGDYINASYVQGYGNHEKFIASQGPTEAILEDFLRMLWELEVDKVVMLTNLVEDGKKKCERYWPEDGDMKVGEMTVKLTTSHVFADYIIRRLQLRQGDKPSRNVIQFHFTAWPDKDIPTGPWGLVDFEQRVASYPSNRPLVVHCSAGVGRTGTFIALRNVMREAEETGCVDFFSTVHKLRQDRVSMVQTVDQYIFLHRAAQVAMVCMGTSVSLADVEQRIRKLEAKSKSGETQLQHEFQAICCVCEDKEEATSEGTTDSVYENSQKLMNRQKNRFSSILPKEMYRAVLSCDGKASSDYINAVLVPSFDKQNQEILTQLPLPSTVLDFWRLITQYKITLIVAFKTESTGTDRTVGDYIPDIQEGPRRVGEFTLRTEPETTASDWVQETVYITKGTDMTRKADIPWCLTHVTCSTNLDPANLLAVTQHVRSLKNGTDGRTLYMCRNGAEHSGLVCVLCLLLDRMDNDHHLTVPPVVGAIKAIRPQVIATLTQYGLLYTVLQLHGQSMNEYFNY